MWMVLQITDCTSAIGLKEDYGKAYSRRAQAYSELEEFQEAVRDLEKLKELEPDNDDVRPKLRQAKLDLKKSQRKDYYKCVI
jgi:DnaJ family protein C protein 3